MRWMLGGSQPTNQSPGQRRPIARRQHRVTPQMVEMVLAMFPDIPQPAIIADLQRTGAVETTVDNALRNGGLPMPVSHSSTPPSGSSSSSNSARKSPVHTNLIQRYNLDSKNTEKESLSEPPKVWEASADKRQEMLRKRKEFMVLQARKKLAEEQKRKEEEKKAELLPTENVAEPEKNQLKETSSPNYEDMSVDELNDLGPEQKRQHMLEALERRKLATGENAL
ncbi:hypothetical protein J3Q64DRAFT_1694948 [Phycomyces blakesleeanus]|uniref:CUE domain-containing protein n=2 Tax=Phycomyces blakesleeanus TaxID=4837 RepID=A0A167PVE8_PHYB8|nr:hypothetical protein PHYBLDRAFT_157596 [Phycomyces blakesleeanus NRRL 1555(-)]OAD78606.1 hypothetical protein PHYBLDRAFT_157596 [Phycomyces blakesleeanus NRRL 1555(-)]|eukprot:XP_018296646.1 hypothetical protein PHYBLDRAFT_157596 [Phycomyces blakesleeanus NRRL 1555(-)]